MYLFGCGCKKKSHSVRTRPQVTKPAQQPPPAQPPAQQTNTPNQSNGYQGQGSN